MRHQFAHSRAICSRRSLSSDDSTFFGTCNERFLRPMSCRCLDSLLAASAAREQSHLQPDSPPAGPRREVATVTRRAAGAQPCAEQRAILDAIDLGGPWWGHGSAFDDGHALWDVVAQKL